MSQLRSAVDELEAEDLDATPDAVLAQDIVELFRFADQIHAQALRRMDRFDRRMAAGRRFVVDAGLAAEALPHVTRCRP